MSLWTPGGEHEVPRDDDRTPSAPTGAPGAAGAPGQPPLSPEQEAEAAQIAAEMAEVRAQLGQVPAAQVVANHAMGCWELAAIHLSAQPPKFEEAQIAIDAFGALTEVLKGRLGEDEATLADALAQLRLAFVQMKASFGTDGGASDAAAAPPEG
ncbi:hypothetical protein ACE2AJ_02185 [Aquihabitans daechungensis]|uniref:hypothetical protein n=1 Tax=Aquihabitans daechungensis TaxID=1052257 RepID=UPI003B9F1B81